MAKKKNKPSKNKPSKLGSIRKKSKPLTPELNQVMQKAYSLHQQGKSSEAQQLYLQVLTARPDSADANFLLGVLLFSTGNKNHAEPYLRNATDVSPNESQYVAALGVCYLHIGRYSDAEQFLERATKLAPRDMEPQYNLGTAYLKQKKFTKAKACFNTVLKHDARHIGATNNLGLVYSGLGNIEESTRYYEKAFHLDPSTLDAASNFVFNYNYFCDASAQDLFDKHENVGEHFPKAECSAKNLVTRKERIRIGYVSADFHVHSVAYFLWPLIAHHDPDKVEIYCYYNGDSIDWMTERFKSKSAHWEQTSSLSNEQFAQLVRNHEIDILIDLAGHSGYNRLAAFSLRAAPVQLTWLGYPHSTGLKEMDYRLIDEITDPSPSADALSTEELIRLPDGFLCYEGDAEAAYQKSLPYLSTKQVTFGSFNNLSKVNNKVIETWIEILRRVPNSRLVLKAKQLSESSVNEMYQAYFSEANIDLERVELRGYAPNAQDHLAQYNEIDIAFDTFPYNGTTTTCEALWMGVPTITFAGDRHASRVGASIMAHAGYDQFIANDVDSYIQLAEDWANNMDSLAELRKSMREQIQRSRLCDAPRFARDMEEAFAKMMNQVRC